MRPGEIVTIRDQSWIVTGTEAFERCTVLTLEGRGPGNTGHLFHAIAPFDRVDAAQTDRPRRRKRRAVLRGALGAIADDRPALGLWTAAGANLDLLAYQLEPALAVLRGASRVLLADGVGLGKTVQAGLILAELRARGLVDRALVLCPAGLRESWAHELRDRFAIIPAVLDQTSIATGLQALPAGVNPWSAHSVIVASIDLVKRPEVLAAAEEVAFDLVIVDEAHHLTPASDRGHAVNRLASRAPWLVLVTATPHSGDQAAFDYLTAIGSLGDPLTVFRRHRTDIGVTSDRRSRLLGVVPTPDEAHLLQSTDAYVRAMWRARGQSDPAVQLVAITLSRRAASSPAALAHTLTRRRGLLSDAPPPMPAQEVLPWDEVDDDDGEESMAWLACPGLPDANVERGHLDALIDLAHRASALPSKLHRLGRLLARAGEPAVVFTEYRDTLDAAAGFLSPRFRLGAIHGGVPVPMRQEVLRQFECGDLDLLIATDTAGEGLNLHRRCRLVINLELPWNPRRLEQRVGRVDRIGQQRRVHAVHLLHRGSIEDRVWSHLEKRRIRAGQAFGDHDAPTELEMARAIFDNVGLPDPAGPFARRSLGGGGAVVSVRIDAVDELARVARQRRWRPHASAGFDRPIYALPRRAGHRDGRAIALYERTQIGPTGGLIERRVHAMLVHISGARTTTNWREIVAAVCHREFSGMPDPVIPPARLAVVARIAAMRDRLASQPQLHQAALFDRRAERLAGSRRDVVAQLDAALARRAASLGPVDSRPIHSRLIACWPLEPKR